MLYFIVVVIIVSVGYWVAKEYTRAKRWADYNYLMSTCCIFLEKKDDLALLRKYLEKNKVDAYRIDEVIDSIINHRENGIFDKNTHKDGDHDYRKYYTILGVDITAKKDAIKRAFKKLAFIFHPDRLVGLGISKDEIVVREAHYKKINEAYETLMSDELRKAYDAGEL